VAPGVQHWDIDRLPDKVVTFLLGSRYCDTEKASNLAQSLFGGIDGGWQRVQAICDYARDRIEFCYHHAHPTALLRKRASSLT